MIPARPGRLQRLLTRSLVGAWLAVWFVLLAGMSVLVWQVGAGQQQLREAAAAAGVLLPADLYQPVLTGILHLGGSLLILSGVVIAALLVVLNRLFFQPLEALRAGAERLGQGELDHRLNPTREDELGALARAFDQMASRLQQREAQMLAQARLLLTEIERRRSAENETQLRFAERQQAEAALRESEARFRAVVGNVDGAVYRRAADTAWTIRFISDGVEALTGYPPARFLNQPAATFFSLILPEDAGRVETLARQTLSAGQPFEVEYRLRRADGGVIWVLDRARLVPDAAGALQWIDGLVLDITRRKRLELDLAASRERYELAVLGSTDGLWDWNITTGEVYYSPRWKAMLGYADDELENKFETWTDLIHAEDLPRVLADLDAYLHNAQPTYRAEFRMRHKQGGYRWIVTRGVALRDTAGRAYRMAGSHTDITERKQFEDDIRRLNAELEERVAERTAQLERANAALEAEGARLAERIAERTADLSAANAELARVARAKDEFLASMSHELRTPLNTILGMAEALQDEVYGPLSAGQALSLRNIEESGRHLLALINDLLDISKIEAGKLELQWEDLDVSAVCEASLRLVRPAAQKKRLNMQLEIDPTVTHVRADARRLKQILVNLLSNAIKFTPEGGAFGLAVHGEPEREAVVFTVWDSGIGIAPADIPKLFRPFAQLDSRLARAHLGSGLGLTLVYRMVDLHGGGVSVVSTPGEGSRFSVALPWAPVADPSAEMSGPGRIEKALLFQPELDPVGTLASSLSGLGVWAIPHVCGPMAFETAASLQPPLVVLELTPGLGDCWQLLRQLKRDPRTATIPVIAVVEAEIAAAAVEQGATEVVLKPVTREGLRSAISGAGLARRVRTGRTGALPAKGSAGAAPLILVADDHEMRLLAQSRQLQAWGYRPVIARNGREALERALEEPPALILLEAHLPALNSLDLIRRIRAQPETALVPILVINTLALAEERDSCLRAGATAYFCRPVSAPRLLQALNTYAVPLRERTV